ncbi:transketolase [Lacticaseibacillus sp. GG6-2]
MKFDSTDDLAVNTIRMLSVAQIQAANSGHPGLPLGAAPMAYVLYRNHLTVTPRDTRWFNRDRFVLSAGHGSAMLYSLQHLAGFAVTKDDLQHFRQFGSRTPGHPEYGVVDGVEATTGPLGQGLGMAVGMAMAERHMAARLPGMVNHFTYVIAGDGDFMEGVSHEAMGLAGHQGLGKLIVLFDSNDVSLDGTKGRAFGENMKARCEAEGWAYARVEDGNDLNAIDKAITAAKREVDKPSMIEVRTIIGYGAREQGTNGVHGKALSVDDYAALKTTFNWTLPDFEVPQAVYQRFADTLQARGATAHAAWQAKASNLAPAESAALTRATADVMPHLPEQANSLIPETCSGRDAGKIAMNAFAKLAPEMWGGAADLASSTKTVIDGSPLFDETHPEGRNIAFGVREFAMGAALNGIALHGGSRVFGSTFLVFADYLKPAIRLAAMQHLPVTFVFTHDSIAVGEDGPTHEPIEQLAMLRTIPNTVVIRPADGQETAAAWRVALTRQNGPTVIVLTRQDLPQLSKKVPPVKRGAYVAAEVPAGKPQEGILLASGSEVHLAMQAQLELAKSGRFVSVVSVPSFELFAQQSRAYQESVLPRAVTRRVAVEMASPLPWGQLVGLDGAVVGMESFGASGKADRVMEHFGFTPQHVADTYLQLDFDVQLRNMALR